MFRRANQLNNIVFFATLQPSILEIPGVAEQFDAWMNALMNTKFDCLAVAASLPGTGESIEATRRRQIAGVMDTIARGLFSQAVLRKAQPAAARQAICGSYKAAVLANLIASSESPQRLDFSNHEAFLGASFAANGEAANKAKFHKATADYVRLLRGHVEALGEGACASGQPAAPGENE